MTALLAGAALSFVLSLALESRPVTLSALAAPWRATALRILLHLVIFAGAFALSWRPWHAAFVTVVIAFLFGSGSAMKQRILGEPVVFSDFALVRLAIRHPRLYYAERLAEPRALGVFALIAVATAGWFAVEPPILPSPVWAWIAAPPVACGAGVLALRSGIASKTARSVLGDGPDLDADVRRFGLGGAMLLHWLAWRGQTRPSPVAAAVIEAAREPTREGPAVVVAIQCESFVDIADRGLAGPALPSWRALRDEALAWGRCRVPAEGAYTMRSEFGFLTGIPSRALGFDVFDPFLVADAYAPASVASRLKRAGRRTVMIHPYDPRFFDRDILVPGLGFDRFVAGDAFQHAARAGRYVGDAAVADAILAEIAGRSAPLFVFAVTMENHGPWGPGRIAGVDDPAGQYAIHLANADRMIGRVAEALRRVPGGAVLCLYGDHAPARTLHPELPERRATDYLIWDSRAVPDSPLPRENLDVDEVGRRLVERALAP